MSKFLSKRLQNLQAYTPGEQPKLGDFIKLNTNESPYSPPKEALDILQEKGATLNYYNDPTCKKLTETFAKYYDINEENVIFANGSDEILVFCYMTFCDANIGICFPEISYGFYEVYADLFGLCAEKIPLNEDLSIDVTKYFNKNKTIVIANPNAPTGLCLSIGQIEQIVQNNPNNVVVIDEAYVDFGGESAVKLTEKYENLIVCGTFSKSRNLAGGRLGYAIASKTLMDDLNRVKYSFNPYNVGTLAQALGAISIEQDVYFKECVKKIVNAREKFIKDLNALGFDTIPSKANFIFTKNDKIHGSKLYQKLKDRKILVRHFDKEKISKYVRISIGTQAEMDEVVRQIAQILEEDNA
ncbi:MAG: histidinol-phosphate transaminase [Clostridia bacterium]